MRTSLDIVDIVRAHLADSVLMATVNKPNGALYKFQRPQNSVKEDVVVNSLANNMGAVGEGVLNVNIYVPNLIYPTVSVGDLSQPNLPRLTYLTTLAFAALTDVYADGYNFTIQSDSLFADDNNQHYSNIRVEFNSINI